MGLYVQESVLSRRDDGSVMGLGDGPVYESYHETDGELFRACQREHGRCISRVYIDTASGTKAIGWVFEARRPYQDCPRESSIIETWVSIHDSPPITTTTYAYHELEK
jgi:hypothetical protein